MHFTKKIPYRTVRIGSFFNFDELQVSQIQTKIENCNLRIQLWVLTYILSQFEPPPSSPSYSRPLKFWYHVFLIVIIILIKRLRRINFDLKN